MSKHGTKIEWTQAPGFKGQTWNPFRGTVGRWHCAKVSPGCAHCYAESLNQRWGGPEYAVGTDMPVLHLPTLEKPLRWRKPRMVFVCSMTDLFYEGHSFGQIASVFGVMAASPQHTFQVLTKRPARALEWFAVARAEMDGYDPGRDGHATFVARDQLITAPWPLPNVWLGVSVENQRWADERIPLLLQCPAKVRFVSYEPALGPVDFTRLNPAPRLALNALSGLEVMSGVPATGPSLTWLIVGGESGPQARPCRLDWIRSTIRQCREAETACFVKQLGTRPELHDPKGGDPREWPEDLWRREWPT